MTSPDMDAARAFLVSNARVLDRRRYERLFEGGPAEPVRDAIAAYRNDDGGFGHALEPDGRTPASQPIAIELALRTMNETDVWDADLVAGACDWLERNAPAAGGVTGVHPSIADWPHAPWLEPDAGSPPSLITTGLISGLLHARAAQHPWLDRATTLMWERIAELADPGPYQLHGVVAFLEHVPDRERALAAWSDVEPLIREVVTLDPAAPGEVHGPLAFAPEPDSLARRMFDGATIEAHLDHLAGAQLEDGGWTFNWLAWSPVAERDWRGSVTVDALRMLRANGRL